MSSMRVRYVNTYVNVFRNNNIIIKFPTFKLFYFKLILFKNKTIISLKLIN